MTVKIVRGWRYRMPGMLGSQRVLVRASGHSFTLDDTRVRQPLDEIDHS